MIGQLHLPSALRHVFDPPAKRARAALVAVRHHASVARSELIAAETALNWGDRTGASRWFASHRAAYAELVAAHSRLHDSDEDARDVAESILPSLTADSASLQSRLHASVDRRTFGSLRKTARASRPKTKAQMTSRKLTEPDTRFTSWDQAEAMADKALSQRYLCVRGRKLTPDVEQNEFIVQTGTDSGAPWTRVLDIATGKPRTKKIIQGRNQVVQWMRGLDETACPRNVNALLTPKKRGRR